MSRGGRDQLGPIERLVRVLAVLESAGSRGATQRQLLDAAQYSAGQVDDQRRMLNRDIKHLNEAGWDIENTSEDGLDARYVLHARDIRLRVELSRAEQAELARIGRIAGVDEFAEYVGTEPGSPPEHSTGRAVRSGETAPDVNLALCLGAAASQSVVQFMYKRRPRTVHPRVVQPGPSGWYLIGCEEGASVEKYFVVDRMRNIILDQPGTAMIAEDVQRSKLDPATWNVDPAVGVEVETTAAFVTQVKLALGPAIREVTDGERVILTVRVTNRAAFRLRIYPLGVRVRVLGPADVRDQLIEELSRMAGAS